MVSERNVSHAKGGIENVSTFFGDIFPIPIVELNFSGQRFADKLLWVFGPEWSVTAKQYVGDDTIRIISARVREE